MSETANYDHYSPEMIERLDGPFGLVEIDQSRFIRQAVAGQDVLDFGCGFGQLVEYLRVEGFNATGVDLLDYCIESGRKRFPKADLRVCAEGRLPFADQSFDTVILKDAIHHLYDEGNLPAALSEVRRVCKGRLIVFDPNPMPLLLLARKLIGHVDPICSPDQASRALADFDFKVVQTSYRDLFAFPLSGGFVGPRLIGNWLAPAVLGLDNLILGAASFLSLERFICWRYMLVANLHAV